MADAEKKSFDNISGGEDKAEHTQQSELAEKAERRKSVALNIVENPLKVSCDKMSIWSKALIRVAECYSSSGCSRCS